jgi:hypothetical protein
MRLVLVLVLTTLVLAGCKREAQEAVAQAKGAAADAERAAKEAANQAKTATDEAAAKARAAAEQARGAAAGAGDSAKQTIDSTGQSLREMTEGDQVQGALVGAGSSEVSVRPTSGKVQTLHTDAQTRWILRGPAAGKEGLPTGSSVRITYIVKNGQRVATQVEAIPH